MADKARAVFEVLGDWPACSMCQCPIEPWPYISLHPICYLRWLHLNDYSFTDVDGYVDEALEAILND